MDSAYSQEETNFEDLVEKFGWSREGIGEMKRVAEIEIPEGYRFSEAKGAGSLMELYGNQKTGKEYGVIGPESLDWCVLFEFDQIGYVDDSEKDDLSASKMLKQMRSAQKQQNKALEEMGLTPLEIVGWAREPYYNEQTNNLEWALLLEDPSGQQTVNLRTKILGRRGVMESILICDPSVLDDVIPEYEDLLEGYAFKDGQSYAEYRDGDQLAKIGLTGLVLGGGAVAAWKFGPKLIKILIAGLVVVGGFFAKMFGRGE